MNCILCSREFSVHLLDPDSSIIKHYCPECDAWKNTSNVSCKNCGFGFDQFFQKGLLGCEKCYIYFSSKLKPLIKNYQKELPIKRPHICEYKTDSIAKTRSEEIRDYVFSNQTQKQIHKKPLFSDKTRHFSEKNHIHATSDRVCFRIRVARNIQNIYYLNRLSAHQKKRLQDILLSPGSNIFIRLADLGPDQIGLISDKKKCSLEINSLELNIQDFSFRVYCNEEDHLRIELKECIPIRKLDLLAVIAKRSSFIELLNDLDTSFQFQYSAEYGFLTACPAISGAATRISCQIYIPWLVSNKPQFVHNLSEDGFEIRSPGSEKFDDTSLVEISYKFLPYNFNLEKRILQLTAIVRRLLEKEKIQ